MRFVTLRETVSISFGGLGLGNSQNQKYICVLIFDYVKEDFQKTCFY